MKIAVIFLALAVGANATSVPSEAIVIGPGQWTLPANLAQDLVASVGQTIQFSWLGVHNVFIHPSGSCDETGAVLVAPTEYDGSGMYQFTEADAGKEIVFACDVSTHCEEGGMHMRVLVTGGGETSQPSNTIVDVAAAQMDTFSTLVTALTTAGLDSTLASPGDFTVFAPTNDAFSALPDGALDFLIANPSVLTSVLLYHVVQGSVPSSAIGAGGVTQATTLNGAIVSFTIESTDPLAISVNNAAVVVPDVQATNGVIHVIDSVLLPPGLVDLIDVTVPTEPWPYYTGGYSGGYYGPYWSGYYGGYGHYGGFAYPYYYYNSYGYPGHGFGYNYGYIPPIYYPRPPIYYPWPPVVLPPAPTPPVPAPAPSPCGGKMSGGKMNRSGSCRGSGKMYGSSSSR
eukprot:scaffold2072_cov162-Amphora_coffeaeformis.AAC.2